MRTRTQDRRARESVGCMGQETYGPGLGTSGATLGVFSASGRVPQGGLGPRSVTSTACRLVFAGTQAAGLMAGAQYGEPCNGGSGHACRAAPAQRGLFMGFRWRHGGSAGLISMCWGALWSCFFCTNISHDHRTGLNLSRTDLGGLRVTHSRRWHRAQVPNSWRRQQPQQRSIASDPSPEGADHSAVDELDRIHGSTAAQVTSLTTSGLEANRPEGLKPPPNSICLSASPLLAFGGRCLRRSVRRVLREQRGPDQGVAAWCNVSKIRADQRRLAQKYPSTRSVSKVLL